MTSTQLVSLKLLLLPDDLSMFVNRCARLVGNAMLTRLTSEHCCEEHCPKGDVSSLLFIITSVRRFHPVLIKGAIAAAASTLTSLAGTIDYNW